MVQKGYVDVVADLLLVGVARITVDKDTARKSTVRKRTATNALDDIVGNLERLTELFNGKTVCLLPWDTGKIARRGCPETRDQVNVEDMEEEEDEDEEEEEGEMEEEKGTEGLSGEEMEKDEEEGSEEEKGTEDNPETCSGQASEESEKEGEATDAKRRKRQKEAKRKRETEKRSRKRAQSNSASSEEEIGSDQGVGEKTDADGLTAAQKKMLESTPLAFQEGRPKKITQSRKGGRA